MPTGAEGEMSATERSAGHARRPRIAPRQTCHEVLARAAHAGGRLRPGARPREEPGPALYDAADGRWYLDLFSCFATLPVGLNHPEACSEPRVPRAAAARGARQPDQLRHLHGRDGGVRRRRSAGSRCPTTCRTCSWSRAGRWASRTRSRRRSTGRCARTSARATARRAGTRCSTSARRSTGARATRCRSRTPPIRGSTSTSRSSTGRAIAEPQAALPGGRGRDRARAAAPRTRRSTRSRTRSPSARTTSPAILLEPIQAEGGDNHFRPEFLRRCARSSRTSNDALLDLRRGADRHGHHRPHVGAPALGRAARTCSPSARRRRCAA